MAFNIPLAGQIEPTDPSWANAATTDRRAFYQRSGEVAVRILREQLRLAIGADGQKMIPRQKRRRDGANGPVLSPHYGQSRTMRLMTFKAWDHGVTVFWQGGMSRTQKLPWGKILGFHAHGEVIGAYLRDVRLAPRSIRKIVIEMARWWEIRMRNVLARRPARPIQPVKRPVVKVPAADKPRPPMPPRMPLRLPPAPVPQPTVTTPAPPEKASWARRAIKRVWEGIKSLFRRKTKGRGE